MICFVLFCYTILIGLVVRMCCFLLSWWALRYLCDYLYCWLLCDLLVVFLALLIGVIDVYEFWVVCLVFYFTFLLWWLL